MKNTNIKICYDKDNEAPTLEPQIVKCNELEILNSIFGFKKKSKEELLQYMQNNKTECALMIFENKKKITIPKYIENALR